MKTMQDYTNYCSNEQTRRAYKLGAPLSIAPNDFFTSKNSVQIDSELYSIPTTQQMIGWLREKGLLVSTHEHVRSTGRFYSSIRKDWAPILDIISEFDTYEQAELAAIDAALDYLEKR